MFVADGTLDRSRSGFGVRLLVHGQAGCLREALVAQFTLEWPFASMNAHVCVEAAGLSEGLLADGALEGFGTGMAFHVLDKLAGLLIA